MHFPAMDFGPSFLERGRIYAIGDIHGRSDPRERARPRPAPPSALVRAPSHSRHGCDIFVGPWDGPDRVMEDS
jgi:hypothetical protein